MRLSRLILIQSSPRASRSVRPLGFLRALRLFGRAGLVGRFWLVRPLRFALLPRTADEALHRLWQLGDELERLAAGGMVEAEGDGVQGDAFGRPAFVLRPAAAITRIAEDRMTVLGEVDADLVAAAGLELDFDYCRVGQVLLHAKVRDGEFAFGFVAGREADQVLPGAHVRAERAVLLFDLARDDRHVEPLRLAGLELLLQCLSDQVRLGEHE